MTFQDLDELLGSPKKELPIGGRMVTFPDRISKDTGLLLLRVSQRAKADPAAAENADTIVADLLDEAGWQAVQSEVLGRSPEELMAEGWSGDHLAHIFKTLITWHLYGRDTAEEAWSQVGNPPAPNRASRRATATTTRSRGSSSGTTAKKAAPRKATPGRGSSATGR